MKTKQTQQQQQRQTRRNKNWNWTENCNRRGNGNKYYNKHVLSESGARKRTVLFSIEKRNELYSAALYANEFKRLKCKMAKESRPQTFQSDANFSVQPNANIQLFCMLELIGFPKRTNFFYLLFEMHTRLDIVCWLRTETERKRKRRREKKRKRRESRTTKAKNWASMNECQKWLLVKPIVLKIYRECRIKRINWVFKAPFLGEFVLSYFCQHVSKSNPGKMYYECTKQSIRNCRKCKSKHLHV